MKVYLDYNQEELDIQYEHRHFVPDAEEFIARHRVESERVRAAAKGQFDVAYGPSEDEILDIYLADSDAPVPTVVFFHGGRWAMGSKTSNCEGAEVYTAQGVNFVSVNFTLLPNVTMDELVRQCRAACAWLWRNAESYGGDRDRMFVHGKSSGGHVAAMMAVTDWKAFDQDLPADLFKGGLVVSGMYDLEPVRRTFRNEWLKLDKEGAARNSPILYIPENGIPLIVGVGALETDEFRRHAREFAAAWRARGFDCRHLEMEGRHHFSVNDEMKDPDGALVAPFLGWMGI